MVHRRSVRSMLVVVLLSVFLVGVALPEEGIPALDDLVSAIVRGEDDRPHLVGRALAARYLKRVVAHLTNVLSAVVMPIDRLDYFDEDPEDRE